MTLDDLIKSQHRHFGINYEGPPRSLSPAEEAFRLAAMLEELSEFILAENIVDKADALGDLIVFALGTCERMGLPIDKIVKAIIGSNLRKELGPNKKRGGFHLDLRKPEGWVPADLNTLLIYEEQRREKENS
jgi:predicted HAD superfamily Cof-like phosphohydrolase